MMYKISNINDVSYNYLIAMIISDRNSYSVNKSAKNIIQINRQHIVKAYADNNPDKYVI